MINLIVAIIFTIFLLILVWLFSSSIIINILVIITIIIIYKFTATTLSEQKIHWIHSKLLPWNWWTIFYFIHIMVNKTYHFCFFFPYFYKACTMWYTVTAMSTLLAQNPNYFKATELSGLVFYCSFSFARFFHFWFNSGGWRLGFASELPSRFQRVLPLLCGFNGLTFLFSRSFDLFFRLLGLGGAVAQQVLTFT